MGGANTENGIKSSYVSIMAKIRRDGASREGGVRVGSYTSLWYHPAPLYSISLYLVQITNDDIYV
jgi:hypothetical protein